MRKTQIGFGFRTQKFDQNCCQMQLSKNSVPSAIFKWVHSVKKIFKIRLNKIRFSSLEFDMTCPLACADNYIFYLQCLSPAADKIYNMQECNAELQGVVSQMRKDIEALLQYQLQSQASLPLESYHGLPAEISTHLSPQSNLHKQGRSFLL